RGCAIESLALFETSHSLHDSNFRAPLTRIFSPLAGAVCQNKTRSTAIPTGPVSTVLSRFQRNEIGQLLYRMAGVDGVTAMKMSASTHGLPARRAVAREAWLWRSMVPMSSRSVLAAMQWAHAD